MMVRFNKLGLVLLAALSLFLYGCGNTYTFNNATYSSSETALKAHDEYLKKVEQDLKPVSSAPKGTAVIVTPSKKTSEALGIKRQGHLNEDIVNYLGKFMEEDYAYFKKFLVKGNLFGSVDGVIDDYPLQYANKVKENYDATIYLDMKSPTQISWFILLPSSKAKQINIDNMAENGAPKIQSWLVEIKYILQEAAK